MVTKLGKINPISYRIGFCFFWNKAFNNTIQKFSLFLRLVYVFSYFLTLLFEKFFKFQVFKLFFFFKYNQILFNLTLYSFNLIYFSIFNLYLPKLYLNRLNFFNLKCLKKKIILNKFSKICNKHNLVLKKKLFNFSLQYIKNIYIKISNNKQFNFFLNAFLFQIFKKKLNCNITDNSELLTNNLLLGNLLAKNLQVFSRLKLKIKSSTFYFLILACWLSLLQKNSYFFTKFISFGLKTRSQKVFLRFLRKILIEFFTIKVRFLKLKTPNFLKGIQIGLFGKIFGKRRSKKLYLKYYIKKTLLTSLKFKNINFTFLKSWTYYGVFGIKVWFFF